MYSKSLEDYKMIRKLMEPSKFVKDCPFPCGLAYLMQQAYEKLIKGYMSATTGRFPFGHNISMLCVVAGISHPLLSKYADTLTRWEASTRYDNVTIDLDILQECFDSFSEVFKALYIKTDRTSRIKEALLILHKEALFNTITEMLPEQLPDNIVELCSLIESALASL